MLVSYKGKERRRKERVDYRQELWYKDRNKDTQGFKHAYGRNISEQGLMFQTYENFPPCTILELRIVLLAPQGNKNIFNVLAEVVHSQEIKRQWLYDIGVSFCKIDNEYFELIKDYLANKSKSLEEGIQPW